MNNQLKKILLLPSLLLANAYLFVGVSEIKTNINLETCCQKINLSSQDEMVSQVVSESKVVVEENKKSNIFEYISLSFLSLSLAVLFFNYNTLTEHKRVTSTINNLVFVKIKLQKYRFYFIKSIQKSFHSIYQKIFFYSFVL
jgi:23S rRNA U2552 (ribose-2'-O)-methylase RlmE/FtsJ